MKTNISTLAFSTLILIITLIIPQNIQAVPDVAKPFHKKQLTLKKDVRKEKKRKRLISKLNKFKEGSPVLFILSIVSGLLLTLIIALIGALPIAYLFPIIATLLGLGGYFVFQNKKHGLARAFLILSICINLGMILLIGFINVATGV